VIESESCHDDDHQKRHCCHLKLCQRMNHGASQPVSDVHHYVIIKKMLDSIYNILLVFIRQWQIQTYQFNNFLTRWQWVCVDDG
jgi:hypothetical protein